MQVNGFIEDPFLYGRAPTNGPPLDDLMTHASAAVGQRASEMKNSFGRSGTNGPLDIKQWVAAHDEEGRAMTNGLSLDQWVAEGEATLAGLGAGPRPPTNGGEDSLRSWVREQRATLAGLGREAAAPRAPTNGPPGGSDAIHAWIQDQRAKMNGLGAEAAPRAPTLLERMQAMKS